MAPHVVGEGQTAGETSSEYDDEDLFTHRFYAAQFVFDRAQRKPSAAMCRPSARPPGRPVDFRRAGQALRRGLHYSLGK